VILNLKSWIILSLPLEYKEFFNRSKWTKNEENMGLELKRGVKLIFSKKLRQTITYPLFVSFYFYFWLCFVLLIYF
jgi:hypothetical protein